VAITQHEPIWFDLAATVDKTCKLIEEAASNGAQLITFPEVWISGYPAWIWSVFSYAMPLIFLNILYQATTPRPSFSNKIHQKLALLRLPGNGPDLLRRQNSFHPRRPRLLRKRQQQPVHIPMHHLERRQNRHEAPQTQAHAHGTHCLWRRKWFESEQRGRARRRG
jgi:hypothetical protein